jgi:outer membrane protein assembly factor BamE
MISRAPLRAASGASRRPIAALALLALPAAGCGTAQPDASGRLLGLIAPYRVEIVQGNVVTRERAALLRPGMTRAQVRDTLGSPMLTDPFHGDRWDYVFTIRRQGTEPQRRSVVVHFKGDTLDRVEIPDALPTESDFVASIAPPQRSDQTPVLELTPEQRKALPAPPKPEVATAQLPAGPVRSYPPLETP